MENKYRILVIEDDEAIRKELRVLLETQGYECLFYDLHQLDIKKEIQQLEPHLIVLDINLPHLDGFTLCTQIRQFSMVPIIVVTSRNSDMDELYSMTIGADDFITKPYHSGILLARIQALLKRTYEKKDTLLMHRDLILDIAQSRMQYHDASVELTKNELKILYYLFLHQSEIVARDDLIDYLWDNKLFVDDNALSVNINRLRSKMKEMGLEDFIKTKHRQGYLI